MAFLATFEAISQKRYYEQEGGASLVSEACILQVFSPSETMAGVWIETVANVILNIQQ